jgi:MFS family permease
MTAAASANALDHAPPFKTDVPARMDALPFSGWHVMILIALGVTWVLDGLETTLSGAVGNALRDPRALGLTETQIGLSGTAYLTGAVIGALVFGWATDRYGRKKLFFLTLALYVGATAATAFSWGPYSYFLFRALTGAGIGGEYAAINSAVDELIPARVRGHVDLFINSTFWLGAAMGSGVTSVLLDPRYFDMSHGWRYAFAVGAVLGLGILILRNSVPESPRWLMTHGRKDEADRIVYDVECKATHGKGAPAKVECKLTEIHPRGHTPWREILRTMLVEHRTRSMLGLSLMVAQAFFYNAAGFFSIPLILGRYYHVSPGHVSLHLLWFALGNALGPVILGPLFDSIGRKPMIIATYATSGVLLAVTGFLFKENLLTPTTQSIAWSVVFFIASCAASAAYLTVSEIFPLELRAVAISLFYAAGTLVGGVAAPAIFGHLIQSGSRAEIFWGYVAAMVLMLGAAGAEAVWGVKAERQSLEDIATPLSSRAAA